MSKGKFLLSLVLIVIVLIVGIVIGGSMNRGNETDASVPDVTEKTTVTTTETTTVTTTVPPVTRKPLDIDDDILSCLYDRGLLMTNLDSSVIDDEMFSLPSQSDLSDYGIAFVSELPRYIEEIIIYLWDSSVLEQYHNLEVYFAEKGKRTYVYAEDFLYADKFFMIVDKYKNAFWVKTTEELYNDNENTVVYGNLDDVNNNESFTEIGFDCVTNIEGFGYRGNQKPSEFSVCVHSIGLSCGETWIHGQRHFSVLEVKCYYDEKGNLICGVRGDYGDPYIDAFFFDENFEEISEDLWTELINEIS